MSKYEWLKGLLYEWSNHRRRVSLYDLIADELDKRYPDPEPEIVDGWPVWTTNIRVREVYGASAQLPAVGSIVQSLDGKRFRVTSEFRPPKENNAHWATGLCASIASRDYHHTSPRIILEPVKTRKIKVPRVVRALPGDLIKCFDWYAKVGLNGEVYGLCKLEDYETYKTSGYCKVEVTFDEVEVPDE